MHAATTQLDLTDAAASGVYFVTAADLDDIDRAAGAEDFNVHRIGLAGCRSRDSLAKRLATNMRLTAEDGRDWPRLMMFLKDMDGMPSRGHVTLLHDLEDWRAAAPEGLDATLDDLDEIATIWAEQGVAFFVFLSAPD